MARRMPSSQLLAKNHNNTKTHALLIASPHELLFPEVLTLFAMADSFRKLPRLTECNAMHNLNTSADSTLMYFLVNSKNYNVSSFLKLHFYSKIKDKEG